MQHIFLKKKNNRIYSSNGLPFLTHKNSSNNSSVISSWEKLQLSWLNQVLSSLTRWQTQECLKAQCLTPLAISRLLKSHPPRPQGMRHSSTSRPEVSLRISVLYHSPKCFKSKFKLRIFLCLNSFNSLYMNKFLNSISLTVS